MRALAQNPSEAELKELVDEIGTETIDFDQFVTLMRKKAKKEDKVNEDELREGLKLFDVERTGVLTTQQLRFMISAYGEKWTEEEIEEMIRDADTDNDGMVNYEEFVKTIVQQ
jgi:calmodulin